MAKKGLNVPGAGTYTVPSAISEGPKWGIGAKLPGAMDGNRTMRVPGPGAYDLINKDNVRMKNS